MPTNSYSLRKTTTKICGDAQTSSSIVLGDYGNLVDTIHVRLIERQDLSCTAEEALGLLVKLLDREQVEYELSQHRLDLYGISFTQEQGFVPARVNIQIDPSVADVGFSILEKAIRELRTKGVPGTQISLHFVRTVACLQQRHKITARVNGTDVKMAPEDRLERGDIRFRFDHLIAARGRGAAYLDIEFLGAALLTEQVRDLLTFLFERELLCIEPVGAS